MAPPSTMRAILVEEIGGPEVLLTKPVFHVPMPKSDQLLIKNTFAGINYIDTYFRTGSYPSQKPEILGREASGTVASVGDSVPESSGLKIGDRVVWTNWPGAYAEYTAVAWDRLVKVPDGVKDEDAAGGFLMGLTALSLTLEAYDVKKGDTILIHAAAGGTGMLLVQVCKAKGAHVIGTAGGPEKCKLAKENGADEVIDYKDPDSGADGKWLGKVLGLTDGKGVDAVFDSVGKDTWDKSLQVVKRKGSVVFFGASSGPIPDIPISKMQAKNLKVMRPTMTLYCVTREETEFYANLYFEYLKEGKLRIKIHKVYELEDVRTAHEDLQGRKTSGKLLLKI